MPPEPIPPAPTAQQDGVPFQALVEQSLVGIYVIQDGLLKYANAAFAQMNGYRPDEIVGRPLTELVAPDSLQDVLAKVDERLRRGSSMRYCTRGRHRDGYEIDIDVHGSAVEFQGRPAVVGVAIDISERLAYERELQESHELLRLLAKEMNRVREAQRAHIAREIHDVLGGLLTSIKMDAARILNRADSTELVEITEGLIAAAQEGIEITREMSETLYPAVLDHLGLEAALRDHLARFCQRSGIQGELLTPRPIPAVPQEQALVCFRICQEALTNIARHAHATQVRVTLDCQHARLQLEVCDDGQGLDAGEPRQGALGILGMKERARALKGELTLAAAAEGGTRLCLTLPLPAGA